MSKHSSKAGEGEPDEPDVVPGLDENGEVVTPSLLLSRKKDVEAAQRLLGYTEDAICALEGADRDLYWLVFKERVSYNRAAALMGEQAPVLVERSLLLLKKIAAAVHFSIAGDDLCVEMFGVLQLSAEEWIPFFVEALKSARG
jgi:hypothetical protein